VALFLVPNYKKQKQKQKQKQNQILFYFILFYFILFYFILFYFILFLCFIFNRFIERFSFKQYPIFSQFCTTARILPTMSFEYPFGFWKALMTTGFDPAACYMQRSIPLECNVSIFVSPVFGVS
jgi:ABC-type phosphate transport system permease subunit